MRNGIREFVLLEEVLVSKEVGFYFIGRRVEVEIYVGL